MNYRGMVLNKPKVIVCDHIHESGLEILKNEESIEFANLSNLDKVELLNQIEDADVLITRSSTDVDEKLLESAKSLKAVVRAGVGVDNVNIDEASKKGVIIMNVPTANTIAAVELTMAHMLSNMRFFPYAHNHLKTERVWKREKWYGHELKGKKLGIIGFGNIGSRVGLRAQAFEMDIITYDPYIDPSKATDVGIAYTENFDDILACDVITIHTPKNSETIDMISFDEIKKMKENVVLINCARGGLYNEDALLDGLKSGKIRSAGIDVFKKEPATDHPLLDLDNVTVTPHLGANTVESQYNIATQAAQQAIEAATGMAYPNALNLPIKDSDMSDSVKPYLNLIQKIGFISAKLNKGNIKSIKVYVEGKDVEKFKESLKTFAVVGALKESLGENINYVNAEFIAHDRGVTIDSGNFGTGGGFRNRVGVKITTNKDTIQVAGTIFGEADERIIEINGFELDIRPEGKMILFTNSDVPGVIGDVGTILSKHSINIADFRLGRNRDGKAMAIVHTDSEAPKDVLDELSQLEACISLQAISVI
jgi:D-3-phosphoglycerate dehydrogenase